MQAAFVDIGLDRTAFLHAADIANTQTDDTVVGMAPTALSQVEDIRRLVNQGDDILVQVIKDPIGTKGARLTTFVAPAFPLSSTCHQGEGIGVSTRIDDEAERQRLKNAILGLLAPGASGGYILRTAAQGVSVESLQGISLHLDQLGTTCGCERCRRSRARIVHEDHAARPAAPRDELARGVIRCWSTHRASMPTWLLASGTPHAGRGHPD